MSDVTRLQREIRERSEHPSSYRGYSHPRFLSYVPTIWRALFCRVRWHLFREVIQDEDHYLHCDACGVEFYGWRVHW